MRVTVVAEVAVVAKDTEAAPPVGADDDQVLPLEVSTLPEVLGVTQLLLKMEILVALVVEQRKVVLAPERVVQVLLDKALLAELPLAVHHNMVRAAAAPQVSSFCW